MDKNWSLEFGYSKEKVILCRTKKIIKEKFAYLIPIWPNLELGHLESYIYSANICLVPSMYQILHKDELDPNIILKELTD